MTWSPWVVVGGVSADKRGGFEQGCTVRLTFYVFACGLLISERS